MKLVEMALKKTEDIFKRYLTHMFILELEKGSLPENKFKEYIIQDSLYLREYARVFGYAITKASKYQQIKKVYEMLSFVSEGETSTRLKYIEKYGITEEEVDALSFRKENADYVSFMLEVARDPKADLLEIMMAILPCMLSYVYIFENISLRNKFIKDTKYYDLIKDYTSVGIKEMSKSWISFTNELAKNISSSRVEKLIEIFVSSSNHEMRFWDMSFKDYE